MEIIKNTLKTNHNMGLLKLEDEFYIISIYYLGDYEKEMETGLDVGYLSASVKLKKNIPALEILFREKEVFLNLDYFGLVKITEVDTLITKINIAKNETIVLNKILEEYFYQYY